MYVIESIILQKLRRLINAAEKEASQSDDSDGEGENPSSFTKVVVVLILYTLYSVKILKLNQMIFLVLG